MTGIGSRIAELERRLAAVERVVFRDDPQREAVLRQEDDSQPDIGPVKKAVAAAGHDREAEAPGYRQQVPESATVPGSRRQQAVGDFTSAAGLVVDLPGVIAREAAGCFAPDTAGGLVADMAEIAVSAAEHVHPASLVVHAALDALQMQADIRQAIMQRHHAAHAQREASQREAGG